MSLLNKSIMEIHEDLHNKQYQVSDLIQESQQQIEKNEPKVKAFLAFNEDAVQKGKELDQRLAEEGVEGFGPLFGIPMALKDNILTKGLTTTCGSKMLENYNPVYDGTVTTKLADAQTVLMGKLNMDEFAMGSSNENSAFYNTHNPWNLDHIPGGSSGGSAAAVAAREVFFSLGSDTGGSIRQPAAYCNVVGLKPSYGRVSRYGAVAMASSLDQLGPITKTVADAALVLQAIAGHDRFDSTSVQIDVPDYTKALTGDIKGLRIGLPKEYFGEGIADDVRERINEAIKVLEGLGAVVEEVSLPHSEYAVPAYYMISSAEASSNLGRYDGVGYGVRKNEGGSLEDLYVESRSHGFGREVKRRIILGTYALSASHYEDYFIKAQKVRTLVINDFKNIFTKYDLLLSPTTPTTALKMGEFKTDTSVKYMNDLLTVPVNLSGLPAISVPAGFGADGLPVGLQLIGKAFDEETLLRVAHAFEQETKYYEKSPSL